MLSIRQWDGREKRWEFQDAEKMTLYSAQSHGSNVYIELSMESSQKKIHSILGLDGKDDSILWEYRLDAELPVKAYTGNEQGGITLFVQTDDPNGQHELVLITLDWRGKEISSAKVDGIPATMAINVVSGRQTASIQSGDMDMMSMVIIKLSMQN